MYKIIGGDGKEYGPVSFEEICQWISEGRANAGTLVHAEDSTEWKPMETLPEFAQALGAAASLFPSLVLGESQAVNAGEAAFGAGEHRLNMGGCFEQGWDLMRNHPVIILGASGLVLLIQLTIASVFPVYPVELNLPPLYSHRIVDVPVWAAVVDVLIRGILYGGLMALLLRLIRGHPYDLNSLLADVQPVVPQLVLASVVSTVLMSLGFLLFVLPGIYLAVAWAFTYPVLVDNKCSFWSAMELSRRTVTHQWWKVFGLMLAIGGLNLFAAWLHDLCLFLSLPFSMAILACAYVDLLGRGKANA
jgi:hypothetical protein